MGYSRMARRMGEWLMCLPKIDMNASRMRKLKMACRDDAEMAFPFGWKNNNNK